MTSHVQDNGGKGFSYITWKVKVKMAWQQIKEAWQVMEKVKGESCVTLPSGKTPINNGILEYFTKIVVKKNSFFILVFAVYNHSRLCKQGKPPINEEKYSRGLNCRFFAFLDTNFSERARNLLVIFSSEETKGLIQKWQISGKFMTPHPLSSQF